MESEHTKRPIQTSELRYKLQTALNKLNNMDTREVAVNEAKTLIERNSSLDSLKTYISCLSELRKNKTPAAREQEVALVGHLAELYEGKLGENTLQFATRLAEIAQNHFRDLNWQVREAAAQSLCAVYRFCLPKDSQQLVFSFMFEPLHSLLVAGGDVQAQQAAALVLFKWSQLLIALNDIPTLSVLNQKTLALFVKVKPEYHSLVSAVGLLSEHCGFQPIIEVLPCLLLKLLSYLSNTQSNAPHLKVEACKLLSHISRHISEVDVGRVTHDIVKQLRGNKSDKSPVVQNAAREALKLWEIHATFQEERGRSPATREEMREKLNLVPSHSVKTVSPQSHFKAVRNLRKLRKQRDSALPTAGNHCQ